MSLLLRFVGLIAVLVPVVTFALMLSFLSTVADVGPTGSSPAIRQAIGAAARGSLAVAALATAMAVPLGWGAAIYLEEWPRNPVRRLMGAALMHLAGIPPVVYGLLGVVLFASGVGVRRWSAALTLALLVLPVAALATRDALRRVPADLRRASIALGATRWQMLRQVVLPVALPGLIAATALSLARALAGTTSLLALGVIGPSGELLVPLLGPYAFHAATALGQPGAAASAILVLFVPLILLYLIVGAAKSRLPRIRA